MTEILRCEVAIVGGGMTGLALAAALGVDGVDTVVVDRMPADLPPSSNADPRVTAVALGSVRFLESIGAFAAMRATAAPILDIRVAEAHSPFAVHYDHRDVGDEPLGYIVENANIRDSLIARCRELPAVRLLMPQAYVDVARDPRGATVSLADGRQLRAKLLVAADGKFSRLRERFGIRTRSWAYGQTGIVATLGHELPHDGLAYETFFPDGPFAVLPMRGDRSSIVWALEDELAGAVLALPAEAFEAEVQDRIGDRLGRLSLASPVKSFPMVLKWAERFTVERAALVGDAARGIHPIAGQGWNLALRDAAALAEIVAGAHRLGLDVGSAKALARYERWRRFDALALVAITDGINRLFANDVTALRLARNLGFALVDQVPPLKQLFMRHAMGVMGDLPRRMRPAEARMRA
ncbi:MAG: 2-octaprenyl-6-methoxyphenyl hydroxylase [Geminicoccaceae bacterium]|nr:MAG: 2-octaprenyl-6-methoxyphenyl hydroxylase [Geminicoccaceae bacterium]